MAVFVRLVIFNTFVSMISQIFRIVLLCAAVFCTCLNTGCTKKCGRTSCKNGGTCNVDKCDCQKGYSGDVCQTGWTDETVGTYTCKRSNCSLAIPDTSAWTSSVTKATSNSGYTIAISNFDNANVKIFATVDSLKRISIAPSTGVYNINASGTYSNGKIILHFTLSGGGGYTCDMQMVKI